MISGENVLISGAASAAQDAGFPTARRSGVENVRRRSTVAAGIAHSSNVRSAWRLTVAYFVVAAVATLRWVEPSGLRPRLCAPCPAWLNTR
jgi:hypothetical protein